MIKAIETHYNGYRFRSRLEARWAVFFDCMAEKYQYEPEGFDLGGGVYYLPDFFLPRLNLWCEIKGDKPTQDEIDKAAWLAAGLGKNVAILSGNIGQDKVDGCDGVFSPSYKTRFIAGDFYSAVEQCWFLSHWLSDEHGILPFLRDAEKESGEDWSIPDDLESVKNVMATIEIDRRYYYKKYGKNHRAYTRNNLYMIRDAGWGTDKNDALEMSLGEGFLYTSDKMSRCYRAARSARFEHGESG